MSAVANLMASNFGKQALLLYKNKLADKLTEHVVTELSLST
jgi:hypothetical protein